MPVDVVKETEKRYLIVKDGEVRGDICFNNGKWYVTIIRVPNLAYNHNSLRQCCGYAIGVFAAAHAIIGVEYGNRSNTK
jgi:hypothetical protein